METPTRGEQIKTKTSPPNQKLLICLQIGEGVEPLVFLQTTLKREASLKKNSCPCPFWTILLTVADLFSTESLTLQRPRVSIVGILLSLQLLVWRGGFGFDLLTPGWGNPTHGKVENSSEPAVRLGLLNWLLFEGKPKGHQPGWGVRFLKERRATPKKRSWKLELSFSAPPPFFLEARV